MTANLLTGLGIDEYFTRSDARGTMAFLADALGSTVGLVNSAGARCWSVRRRASVGERLFDERLEYNGGRDWNVAMNGGSDG